MSRSEPTIRVTCDGEKCADKAKRTPSSHPESIEVDLMELGTNDWITDLVESNLEAEGWTVDGDRDLCPECSKEKANAK